MVFIYSIKQCRGGSLVARVMCKVANHLESVIYIYFCLYGHRNVETLTQTSTRGAHIARSEMSEDINTKAVRKHTDTQTVVCLSPF